MESLIIHVVTYNVATIFPNAGLDLSRLLGLENNPDENSRPDIYVIGCQEVKSQPQNIVYDTIYDDPWVTLFKQTLTPLGYVKLRTVRLQGIVLSVMVRRRHLVRVRDTEEQIVRLGLGGMWGNKGAVALRLSMMGVNLCLVNSHLAAHDHLLADRIRNYSDILDLANFQDPATRKLLYHDYLIWLGDLNFRLESGAVGQPDNAAVRQMAADHDLTPLLALDQLRRVQHTGEAFSELREPTLTFKPTYKLVPGRHGEYTTSRRPAWTDRILYKVNADVYDGAQLTIDTLSYQSHPEHNASDHHPVSADFRVKVFSDRMPPCVEFLPISMWLIGADCVAKYRVDPALEVSGWDWIALFRAEFASLDEYISYIWVPRSSSSRNSDHYVAVFPEDSITVPGSYVLVYFGRNGRGVYGVSEPFSVQYGHTARLAALTLDGAATAADLDDHTEQRPLLTAEEAAEEPLLAAEEAVEEPLLAAEEAVDEPVVDADPVVEHPLVDLGPMEGRPLVDAEPVVEHPLVDLGPMEGRPLVDANPGLDRVPALGEGAASDRGQGGGVCPTGEDPLVVSSGATEGVPRRRLPVPTTADPSPEGWEKVDHSEGKEE